MIHEVEWREDFNIGVEIVDKAHRKLFSIVQRILLLTEDEKKNQWACIEGIKYFKNYTIKHFQEEEEYMRSINYSGYPVHKQLHDNLRENTIPAMEQNMEKSNYSAESVEQFLGVCIGWLMGHIMVEDKAITGKAASRWPSGPAESVSQALEESLVLAMKEVFFQDARIFSNHYGGGDIGKIIVYYFVYTAPDGGRIRIHIALEQRLALSAIEMMLNVNFKKVNQFASASVELILQQFLRSIACRFNVGQEVYLLQEKGSAAASAMGKLFRNKYPEYSILLETDMGRLAFCLESD